MSSVNDSDLNRKEAMVSSEAQPLPAVSVIVPSYNAEATIVDCLTSLMSQQTTVAYEVIVVDSSSDSTPQIIQGRFPQIRLLRQEQRTLPARARNLGIQQARAPIIAFIDADCLAAPDWIEAISRAHRRDQAAVGGSVILAKPFTIPGALLFAMEFSEYTPRSRPREIRWLPSCNLSVKRTVLDRYGSFPTDLETSEDIVWSRNLIHRLRSKLLFDPRIRIEHINRNDVADYLRRVRKLGHGSGRSRGFGVVPGGFLIRHSFLIPLLVPYRFFAILKRLLLASDTKRLFGLGLLFTPLLLYGLVQWAIGFWHGAREARKKSGQ